ncbi:hypothetical protein [Blastococcus sp. SYSU DS0539]
MPHAPLAGAEDGRFCYGFAPAGALIVKLPAARVQELVAEGRGEPCSPRPGRPVREWVRIPEPDEAACVTYLREARAFVAGTAAP